VTLVGSTLSKFFTTVRIRSWTSAGGRKVDYNNANINILFWCFVKGEVGEGKTRNWKRGKRGKTIAAKVQFKVCRRN
jgi:hypothetical protein